jgi:hypothetical protein
MKCDKVQFTEQAAKRALRRALNSHNPNRKEKRMYHCPLCKAWHLTSDSPSGEGKKIQLAFKDQWRNLLLGK